MRYSPDFFPPPPEKNWTITHLVGISQTPSVPRIPEEFGAISREAKFEKVRGIFVRAAEVARKLIIARASLQREREIIRRG